LAEMVRVSSRLVMTLEGLWTPDTVYSQHEHYPSDAGMLHFYNNRYSGQEILTFMNAYAWRYESILAGYSQLTTYELNA
ncbi:MAG: hypothetical protein ACXABY_32180, partial [Candidatus Thorarchaeota archaeon]